MFPKRKCLFSARSPVVASCCLAEKALGNTVETMSRGEIRKDGPGPPGHVANWIWELHVSIWLVVWNHGIL